jgi:type IV secretion system protein VirB5
VNSVRSVYTDVAAEKHVITEAYAMVDRDAAGAQALNDWFSNNDPFKRARDETVAVAVESVLPLSGDTWRVEWREARRARQGEKAPPEQWQATITISVSPPSDDATILTNPTGLYVEAFNWSRRQ